MLCKMIQITKHPFTKSLRDILIQLAIGINFILQSFLHICYCVLVPVLAILSQKALTSSQKIGRLAMLGKARTKLKQAVLCPIVKIWTWSFVSAMGP